MKKNNEPVQYVGFGYRFLATILDYIILYILTLIISFIYPVLNLGVMPLLVISTTISLLLDACYEIILTTKFGGTIGKILLNIKVVDESNQFISPGKSIGRYFGKYISYFILGIGHLMILWDKNKQGLHDKMVNTYVIKSDVIHRDQKKL